MLWLMSLFPFRVTIIYRYTHFLLIIYSILIILLYIIKEIALKTILASIILF